MPILSDTRFGRIDYIDEDVLTFPAGLVGFPDLREFLLLCTKPGGTFRWLQSIDLPALAFLLADPNAYVENYGPAMNDELAAAIGLTPETPMMLFTTATIPPGKPEEMTLNLAGPIVINLQTRAGMQWVLDDEAYTIKHRAMPGDSSQVDKVAA